MFFKGLLIFLIIPFTLLAQDEKSIKELVNNFSGELAEEAHLIELSEQLSYFKKHPINLNNRQLKDLEQLYFLSPIHIANIRAYLSTYGKLIDIYELNAIPSLDPETIEKLLPYITLTEVSIKPRFNFKNLKKYSLHDLIFRVAQPIEKSKNVEGASGTYLGSSQKALIKYKYQFTDQIIASLVFEKDAGEKINNFPPDFTSASLSVTQVGRIKKLVIGDYSLQFGQGLSLWSGFSFGKGADIASTVKKDIGLKAYSSANEFSFFRGIASTLSISKLVQITPFMSTRNYDASIDTNLSGIETIKTINESGYHRSLSELANKNTLKEFLYGGVLTFEKEQLKIGVVSFKTHFDKRFIKGDEIYRRFYFEGTALTNIGMHYQYSFKNTFWFGEIAKSFPGKTGWLTGILLSFSKQLSGTFLIKNYAKNYYNFHHQPHAEGDGVNEKGLYAGLSFTPTRKWFLSLYLDYFEFPWLKFQVDAPSQGFELLTQVTHQPSKILKSSFRFKIEQKMKNSDQPSAIYFLDNHLKKSFRFQIDWKLNRNVDMQNRLELVSFIKGKSAKEIGFLIFQDLTYRPESSKLSGNFRIGYFNTHSYNARLYAYEDDVLFQFSSGMYYGQGIRNYINLKYKLGKKIDIWCRVANYNYFSIPNTAVDLDEGHKNSKTEIKFQLRWQW